MVLLLLSSMVVYSQSQDACVILFNELSKEKDWKVECLSRYEMPEKFFVGKFPDTLRLSKVSLDSLYVLRVDGQCRLLGVSPGDTLIISVEGGQLKIDGGNELINSYLNKWTFLMRSAIPGIDFRFYDVSDNTNNMLPLSFFQGLENVLTKNNLLTVLDIERKCQEQLKQSGIKDLRFLSKQRSRIRHVCDFLYACILKIAELNIGFNLPIDPGELIHRVDLHDDSLIEFWQLSALLTNYFDGRRMYVSLEDEDDFDTYLQQEAALIGSASVREFFVLNQLARLVRDEHLERLDRISKACAPCITSEAGKIEYQALCDTIINILLNHPFNGKQALNFSFENQHGEMISLSDFRGKLVLIDIWATWCGPCKKQAPFIKKLKQVYADIEILSLSIDVAKDHDKWSRIVNNQSNMISLFASDAYETPFVRYYRVEYIPHFMLIGPDGTMLSFNARKPSDPLLRMYINKLFENS